MKCKLDFFWSLKAKEGDCLSAWYFLVSKGTFMDLVQPRLHHVSDMYSEKYVIFQVNTSCSHIQLNLVHESVYIFG